MGGHRWGGTGGGERGDRWVGQVGGTGGRRGETGGQVRGDRWSRGTNGGGGGTLTASLSTSWFYCRLQWLTCP